MVYNPSKAKIDHGATFCLIPHSVERIWKQRIGKRRQVVLWIEDVVWNEMTSLEKHFYMFSFSLIERYLLTDERHLQTKEQIDLVKWYSNIKEFHSFRTFAQMIYIWTIFTRIMLLKTGWYSLMQI